MAKPRDEIRDRLLEPAFTAAHRALVRLDDDDVPAPLRVVRSAAKKRALPPPLRRRLEIHLEEPWLRELAVAELGEGDGPAEQASRIFLTRPTGWRDAVEELYEAQVAQRDHHERDSLLAENRRLQSVNDELSRRLDDTEARVQELEQSRDADERLERLRASLDRAGRRVSHLEAEVAEREAEAERLRGELFEADERMAMLRAKAARSSEPVRSGESGARSFGRGRPIETARLLDELVETLRPRPGRAEQVVDVAPLALPSGIRPDSAESIEWIHTIERPVLLIVDGHNVAHDLSPDPGRTARDRVVSEVARLRRLSDGPVSAVVFFDTGSAAETHSNFGVTVRYVSDADSAIEATVAASRIDCIVISTDKEVRARSAAHGALTLWGTALSDWITRR